jgi:hypothetical protein
MELLLFSTFKTKKGGKKNDKPQTNKNLPSKSTRNQPKIREADSLTQQHQCKSFNILIY